MKEVIVDDEERLTPEDNETPAKQTSKMIHPTDDLQPEPGM